MVGALLNDIFKVYWELRVYVHKSVKYIYKYRIAKNVNEKNTIFRIPIFLIQILYFVLYDMS